MEDFYKDRYDSVEILKLHNGCKDPTIYFFIDERVKTIVEVDPRDIGMCDDECPIFRTGDCWTKREDGYCDRPFKPLDYEQAQELHMAP